MEIFRQYLACLLSKKVYLFRVDTGTHLSSTIPWTFFLNSDHHTRKAMAKVINEQRVSLVTAFRTILQDQAHYFEHWLCPVGAAVRFFPSAALAGQPVRPGPAPEGTASVPDPRDAEIQSLKRKLADQQKLLGQPDEKKIRGRKKGDRKGKGKGKDKSGKLNWPFMNFFAVNSYAPKRKLLKALSDAATSGTRLCFKFQEGKCKGPSCPYLHAMCSLRGRNRL